MAEDLQRPKSLAVRVLLQIAGWVLLVAGVAALVLPGPGLVMIAAGLWCHSHSYKWADDLLDPVKAVAYRTAAESVETWPRIAFSSFLALCLAAAGVVWGVHPDAPGWWPVADKWWLLGGWGTGLALIASAIVAWGMIAWSYRTFRVSHETIEQVLEEHGLDD